MIDFVCSNAVACCVAVFLVASGIWVVFMVSGAPVLDEDR